MPTTTNPAAVTLTDSGLLIEHLLVSGPVADAAAHAVSQGADAAETVRRMLQIGALVLQHGANASVVDAVRSELRSHAQAAQTLRAVAEKTASKGFTFEELLHPVLDSAFAPHLDIVEATGGTPGADARNKKGDFTVTLNPGSVSGRDLRVVVEAKDKPSQKLTGKDGALPYLADAMSNRAAHAGVLVCATATPALAGQRLRVYPGNRILVLFDKDAQDPLALEIALQLARTLAAGASAEPDETGLDRGALAGQVARLTEIVEAAAEIRGGYLEASRGLKRIDGAYQTFRADALSVLGELTDTLTEQTLDT